MNILITGHLSALARTLAQEFLRDKHKIVIASKAAEPWGTQLKSVSFHSVDPSEAVFRDVLAAYRFDVVVYLSAREENLLGNPQLNAGLLLDGLKNTLDLAAAEKVEHFFFVSSTEVYGKMESTSEVGDPAPAAVNGFTLLAGEEYCNLYRLTYDLKSTILRVPFLYGEQERDGFLSTLLSACRSKKPFVIHAEPDALCNFLNVNDVADFVQRALHEVYLPEHQIVNLSSSSSITYKELADSVIALYPDAVIKFDPSSPFMTRPAETATAKRYFGWTDVHPFQSELENCAQAQNQLPQITQDRTSPFRNALSESVKWIELIGGALLMQFLSEFTGTLIQFKYVDFRLLFVIVLGFVYGIQFGLLAATLASLSVLYTWYILGYDWALLMYNVGNWFPFAVYFAAGIITGYLHDKHNNELFSEREQRRLIYEKYQFLYGVFEEVRELKDQFREKLIGYRDSFGKIYSITKELDSLHAQLVFSKALSVVETLMESDSVAIYTIDTGRIFARLDVNSFSLNGKIAKSLKLSDVPMVLDALEHGQIFQNLNLLAEYPAYAAPIMRVDASGNTPVAMIVIWSARYTQYTTYYMNLFKVITSLIQDSLSRATAFMDLNSGKMYIQSTRILNSESFLDTVRIWDDMRKNKTADYQLVRVENKGGSIEEFSAKVLGEIRAADSVGVAPDGNYFILLGQANASSIADVLRRFNANNLTCEMISSETFLNKYMT